MVRDPREVKTNPSLVKFLRERLSGCIRRSARQDRCAAAPNRHRRARTPFVEGPLHLRRARSSRSCSCGRRSTWCSPATSRCRSRFGKAGKPLDSGLHITLPFTTAYSLSTRTQNYTMSSDKKRRSEGRGRRRGLGARPGRRRGHGERHGAVPGRSRQGHDGVPQPRHQLRGRGGQARRRAAACASCSRATRSSNAATTRGNTVESDVGHCMKDKLVPQGLLLADFQLKQVTLDTQLAGGRGEEGRRAAAPAAAGVRPRDRAEAGRHQAHPGVGDRRPGAAGRAAAASPRRSSRTARTCR